MRNPKVFVFAPIEEADGSYQDLKDNGCQLGLGSASWLTPKGNNEAEMCAMAAGADALIGTSIRSSPITRKIMSSAEDLRIVAKYTVGVDDVDVDAATDLGILVTHAPTEAAWGGVAEGTIAMILDILKKSREKDEQMKQGAWRAEDLQGTHLGARDEDGYPGITVGIVGLGRCGGRVAELLRPWHVEVLACDPYIEEERFAAHDAEAVDFETLLERSDVVTFHVVLNDETRHMADGAALARMKSDAVLINTSRGQVVAEEALAEALSRGDIRAAALDVYEDEPLEPGSRLLKLGHKVLLSPHMVSSNLDGGLGPGITWATRSVLAALQGEVPENIYNPEAVAKWRQRFEGDRLYGG